MKNIIQIYESTQTIHCCSFSLGICIARSLDSEIISTSCTLVSLEKILIQLKFHAEKKGYENSTKCGLVSG